MGLVTERNETVRAWAHLLTVLFIIAATLLFGWPHYKRYTAKLEAKTLFEIAAMKVEMQQEIHKAYALRQIP